MTDRSQVFVDRERWYSLSVDDRGRLFLEVATGGSAIEEVTVELSDEQMKEYEQRGKSFLDVLALKIARAHPR